MKYLARIFLSVFVSSFVFAQELWAEQGIDGQALSAGQRIADERREKIERAAPHHTETAPADRAIADERRAFSTEANQNDGQALLQAVANEDIQLYKEVMGRLLTQRNLGEFLTAFRSETKNGSNIFHLMAGVQDPAAREFFAREIQKFLRLTEVVYPPLSLSFGGIENGIPEFSKLPISQAFRPQPENPVFAEFFAKSHPNSDQINSLLLSVDFPVLESELERLMQAPALASILTWLSNSVVNWGFREFVVYVSDPNLSRIRINMDSHLNLVSLSMGGPVFFNGVLDFFVPDGIKEFVSGRNREDLSPPRERDGVKRSFHEQFEAGLLDTEPAPLGGKGHREGLGLSMAKRDEIKKSFRERVELLNAEHVSLRENLDRINLNNLRSMLQAVNHKKQQPIDIALRHTNTSAYKQLETVSSLSDLDFWPPLVTGVAASVVGGSLILSGAGVAPEALSLADAIVAFSTPGAVGVAVHELCRQVVRSRREAVTKY